MALAWAVAPLPFSAFFPPQSTAAPPALPPTEDDAAVVLLSLPQAVNAAIASTDAVETNTLPKPVILTDAYLPLDCSRLKNYSAAVDALQITGKRKLNSSRSAEVTRDQPAT